MKKGLKITIGILGSLVLVAAGLGAAGVFMADRKAQRHVDVEVVALTVTGDVDVAHGKYLYESRGCTECHGNDGKGRVVFDSPDGLFVKAPNITRGAGGVVANYTERDWLRIIRHGVKPDGRPAMVMPSEDYNRMSEPDLAALIAYLRALPPVAGEGATVHFPALVKAMYALGAVQDAAEKIDHSLPPPAPVVATVTPQHGAYVAAMCVGCHGEHLSGGKVPGAPPDWPATANLTSGNDSALLHYPDAQMFKAMFRSGKRSDGSAIRFMPFESLKRMSDVDIEALYAYLKTLPPRAAGGR